MPQSTIYLLDRILMKDDYNDILSEIIGDTFYSMNTEARHILNILYRYTKYNKEPLRPVEVTPSIYSKIYGKNINPTKYESLGRKVRKTMNDLCSEGLLYKLRSGFIFNEDFQRATLT